MRWTTPVPKAVHQGLVPCGRGCCPRSALSVPFLFPFCSLSVPLLFPFCSPSVHQVFAKCSPPAFEVNAVARDRHATDVYTSRPKGFPCNPATLRVDADALRLSALDLAEYKHKPAPQDPGLYARVIRRGLSLLASVGNKTAGSPWVIAPAGTGREQNGRIALGNRPSWHRSGTKRPDRPG